MSRIEKIRLYRSIAIELNNKHFIDCVEYERKIKFWSRKTSVLIREIEEDQQFNARILKLCRTGK